MYSELSNEFDYSSEQINLLKKLFKQEHETILETFDKALNQVKEDRRNYLDEKKKQIEQGKVIRLNRRQKLERWKEIEQTYFIRHLLIKDQEIHPSQKKMLLKYSQRHYAQIVKKLYEEEGKPYENKQAHEFFRQMPISVQNDDISFLEYDYSSRVEYELYTDNFPYLVWMGHSQFLKRDEHGEPIWNEVKNDFQYRETDTHVVVQRFYNGF